MLSDYTAEAILEYFHLLKEWTSGMDCCDEDFIDFVD